MLATGAKAINRAVPYQSMTASSLELAMYAGVRFSSAACNAATSTLPSRFSVRSWKKPSVPRLNGTDPNVVGYVLARPVDDLRVHVRDGPASVANVLKGQQTEDDRRQETRVGHAPWCKPSVEGGA